MSLFLLIIIKSLSAAIYNLHPINYYKTMYTTHLSEMTDDTSISLTYNYYDLHMRFICDNNLNSILQYTIKSKETRSKK